MEVSILQGNGSYYTQPCGEEVNILVPEEEAPQEENIEGSPTAEDAEGSDGDAAVSSTAVSPKLIPIPAPVRASVHTQCHRAIFYTHFSSFLAPFPLHFFGLFYSIRPIPIPQHHTRSFSFLLPFLKKCKRTARR